jgi:hypothetical protein
LVLAAAGAPLARVPAALAAPRHEVIRLGVVDGPAQVVRTATPFDLAGVEWSAPRGAVPELRVRLADGRWSRWGRAGAAHDPRGLIGDPVWVGGARELELRSARPLRAVRVHLIRAGDGPRASAAVASLPVLDAGPGQPPIVARALWADRSCTPRTAPWYGRVRLAFVHHTENLNGYAAHQSPALVRAICLFHRNVRGWHDIGYNFLIDRFGTIFEGRAGGIDEPVGGAQAGGFNEHSTGIALIGTFSDRRPSPAALHALKRLVAWKLALHGEPAEGRVTIEATRADAGVSRFPPGVHVAVPRIAGHRDCDQTDCPGGALYRELPRIRRAAGRLAGRIATLTLLPPPAPLNAAGPGAFSGRLAYRDGAPIADAPIALQQLDAGGERTLASVTTGPDGTWSALAALKTNARLRALHAATPASVSPGLELEVAPVITLQSSPSPPFQVSGTIDPPKPRAWIDLYAVSAPGVQSLVSRTPVSVERGSFAAVIAPPAPGSYLLVAHTAADALSAAGSSPVLTVTA